MFIQYTGPKLSKAQKQKVRSEVMFKYRKEQRQNAAAEESGKPVMKYLHLGRLRQLDPPSPYGAVDQSIDTKTYYEFVFRHQSFAAFVDGGFLLVGYHKPPVYWPNLGYPVCVSVGLLMTSATIDAFRGVKVLYPHREGQALQELRKMVENSNPRSHLVQVVPVLSMVLFNVIRCSPQSTMHLLGLQTLIQTKGGINTIKPRVAQQMTLMADLLHSLCLNHRLIVGKLTSPHPYVSTSQREGEFFPSSPLLKCDGNNFEGIAPYIDALQVTSVAETLEKTFITIRSLYEQQSNSNTSVTTDMEDAEKSPLTLNTRPQQHPTINFGWVDSAVEAMNPSDIVPRACELASSILYRALQNMVGLEDESHARDMRAIYELVRFYGLKPWIGMPYIYLWIILIGIGSSSLHERPFFASELIRATLSFGSYHVEVFPVFLENFLHLRQALSSRAHEILIHKDTVNYLIMMPTARMNNHWPSSSSVAVASKLGSGN